VLELTRADSIRDLIASPVKKAPERRYGRNPNALPAGVHDRRKHCRCGVCRQCVDNARWDRIFAEKFADPTYYSHLTPRTTSPLASI